MFGKYRILKFNDLIKFHTCVLMNKASNVMLPKNVQSQFCKNQDIHKYSTRNKEKMCVISATTKLKQMSTNITEVKFWNELYSTFRDSISLNVFFFN